MIQAKNLSKTFKKHQVLCNLNLSVKEGERIALIGANGAGKTTLIRSILGQYKVEGELLVRGLEPRANRVSCLEWIGFVPQKAPPLQMTVEELIAFNAGLSHQTSRQEIERIALDLGFEVRQAAKKAFVRLSGGMQQKLLIALALAKKPKLLIMDEPAANLDPVGRQFFFQELEELKEGCTMLLSSHRVDEVLPLINRIVEMDMGQIVMDETIGITSLAHLLLPCRVELLDPLPLAIEVLQHWGLSQESELSFGGQIAGADRLRFLNAISRISNHIRHISLNERSAS